MRRISLDALRRAFGGKAAPLIEVVPDGGLGNRMFQHMLAKRLQARVPRAVVCGSQLPELGIAQEAPPPAADGTAMRLATHRVDLDAAADWLAGRGERRVRIERTAMRLEYYASAAAAIRQDFALQRRDDFDFSRTVVIHVRLNGLRHYPRKLRPVHRDYPVLPFNWYDAVIAAAGREPLFVGEFGKDTVSEALRSRFPNATFVRSQDHLDDFRLIYSADYVALAPSSFSWLAAWLSPHARTIVLPVAGLLNPMQRPDIDLLPVSDARYRFWRFPPERWALTHERIERVIRGEDSFAPATPAEVAAMLASANAGA